MSTGYMLRRRRWKKVKKLTLRIGKLFEQIDDAGGATPEQEAEIRKLQAILEPLQKIRRAKDLR